MAGTLAGGGYYADLSNRNGDRELFNAITVGASRPGIKVCLLW